MTALSIRYLAEHPDAAARPGRLVRARVGRRQRRAGPRPATQRQLSHAANADRLPICLVGLLGTEPVATATLKFREIEYSPEADFWIGWVCVRRGHARSRLRQGARQAAVEAQAAARGLAALYLHTPTRRRSISAGLADARSDDSGRQAVHGHDQGTSAALGSSCTAPALDESP